MFGCAGVAALFAALSIVMAMAYSGGEMGGDRLDVTHALLWGVFFAVVWAGAWISERIERLELILREAVQRRPKQPTADDDRRGATPPPPAHAPQASPPPRRPQR